MNLTTPTKPARNTGAQLRNTFGDLLTGPGLKDVLASSRRYEMTLPDSATTAAAPPASWPATAGCAPTPEISRHRSALIDLLTDVTQAKRISPMNAHF